MNNYLAAFYEYGPLSWQSLILMREEIEELRENPLVRVRSMKLSPDTTVEVGDDYVHFANRNP